MLQKVKEIFDKKPSLVWYVKDIENLSSESALESILSYGDWQDFLKVKEALGIKMTKSIFENIKSKRRVNLRLATINYFTNYFAKYA